jgi:two-component system, LuxR family, sensor kinase FixL
VFPPLLIWEHLSQNRTQGEIVFALITIFTLIGFVLLNNKYYEKLIKSAEQFTSVFNSVVAALFIIDERGIIHIVNLAAIKMFGYTEAEMLGSNLSMLMSAPHKITCDGYFEILRETDGAKLIGKRQEAVGQRHDGSTFPIEFVITESVVNGKHMFIGAMHDISMRKIAENTLQNQKQLFMQLVENQSVATFMIDAEHRVQHWNHERMERKGQ